jgi:hypothetical protein
MATLISDITKLSLLNPTVFEEDSFTFLQYYQTVQDWYIYDSHELGLTAVTSLANNFTSFHRTVPFPKNPLAKDFWSTIPLGVFRYKMLADGSFYLNETVHKVPGYIVEGIYWSNGFVYVVRDGEKLIQVKLFITKETKEIQLYPDISSL